MDQIIILYVALIALMMCLSAFFSLSETAFTSVNEIKMKKMANDGDRKAQRALGILERYDRFLTSVLVGNNLVNIAASSIATTMFAMLLGAETGALVSTVVMTLLLLMLAEITPKSFAKKNPERVCVRICGIIYWFLKVISPVSWFFTKFAELVSGKDDDQSITEDELEVMIDEIQSDGVLEKSESELIKSAMRLDDKTVEEVFVPRVDIVAVDVDSPVSELQKVILESGYSRIPVYEGSIDNIIGFVYSKTFLTSVITDIKVGIRDILMPVKYIPETISVADALSDMQKSKVNMAVVIDDYGGTQGIFTMEDLLEELVGEIWDEDEAVQNDVSAAVGGRYIVKGDANIYDAMETVGVHFDPEDYDGTTVAGFVMYKLERAPTRGDVVDLENVTIIVRSVKGRRMTDCNFIPKQDDPA